MMESAALSAAMRASPWFDNQNMSTPPSAGDRSCQQNSGTVQCQSVGTHINRNGDTYANMQLPGTPTEAARRPQPLQPAMDHPTDTSANPATATALLSALLTANNNVQPNHYMEQPLIQPTACGMSPSITDLLLQNLFNCGSCTPSPGTASGIGSMGVMPQNVSNLLNLTRAPLNLANLQQKTNFQTQLNGGCTATACGCNISRHPSRFYKTKICPYLLHKGKCSKGLKCFYAHSLAELRCLPNLEKTKFCPSYKSEGNCTNAACPFAHSIEELRHTDNFYKTKLCHVWKKGKCSAGTLCRHAHGPEELSWFRAIARQTSNANSQPSANRPPSLCAHDTFPLNNQDKIGVPTEFDHQAQLYNTTSPLHQLLQQALSDPKQSTHHSLLYHLQNQAATAPSNQENQLLQMLRCFAASSSVSPSESLNTSVPAYPSVESLDSTQLANAVFNVPGLYQQVAMNNLHDNVLQSFSPIALAALGAANGHIPGTHCSNSHPSNNPDGLSNSPSARLPMIHSSSFVATPNTNVIPVHKTGADGMSGIGTSQQHKAIESSYSEDNMIAANPAVDLTSTPWSGLINQCLSGLAGTPLGNNSGRSNSPLCASAASSSTVSTYAASTSGFESVSPSAATTATSSEEFEVDKHPNELTLTSSTQPHVMASNAAGRVAFFYESTTTGHENEAEAASDVIQSHAQSPSFVPLFAHSQS